MFAPLLQGPGPLPPLPGGGGVNFGSVLLNMLFAVLWTIVAAIAFAIAIPVAMRLFNIMTPGIDEFQELKNGNIAVALVYAFFIISATAVVIAILLK
jgi:hypothetical protein